MKSVAAAAILAGCTLAFARESTDITISPGVAVMSSSEQAIVADPAAGIQHGVVLVDETEHDDNKGFTSEIGHHLRAKILSPEGRSLADIAIPIEEKRSELKTFWARAILPDGTVRELKEAELKAQQLAKGQFGTLSELRGAIPGVVPGCVIDYGYVLLKNDIDSSTRVFLQQNWPVQSFRYRWVPNRSLAGAYTLSRSEGLAIAPKVGSSSILITAHDLPVVPDEPHMPPENEARASVTFYYTSNEKMDEYWDLSGKRAETMLKGFLRGSGAVRNAIESMNIPASGTLEAKLRAAYDWIGANVKNSSLLSAEEEEATFHDEENESYSAKTVLMAHEGTPQQLDLLFAGVARELGAEARLVYAVDRTDHFWNKGLKTFSQFNFIFVAVRAPGAPDDQIVLVDAGSGLPYGQVPWRATGSNAIVCGPKGITMMLIPPASPVVNRADTHVTLTYSDDNDAALIKWSRTANGAAGLSERRWLRNLDPRERKDTLDNLCGASSRTEVVAAELPEIDQVSAPYQIACDLEQSDTNADGEISRYSLSLTGAWWPATPEFTSDKRLHPVIFDYPKLDILSMDVTAPHGFRPLSPPAPIELNSQYGRYHLSITKTPAGFHVDRAFALTVLLAKVPEYEALRKYFADVRRADQTYLTFERNGETP